MSEQKTGKSQNGFCPNSRSSKTGKCQNGTCQKGIWPNRLSLKTGKCQNGNSQNGIGPNRLSWKTGKCQNRIGPNGLSWKTRKCQNGICPNSVSCQTGKRQNGKCLFWHFPVFSPQLLRPILLWHARIGPMHASLFSTLFRFSPADVLTQHSYLAAGAASSAKNFGVRLCWIVALAAIQHILRPKFWHSKTELSPVTVRLG